MERFDFALVDATEDPARASDAYVRIHEISGSESIAVYTEVVHAGMEILVRKLGLALLLGPMSVSEWDDFFLHKFPRTIPLSSMQADVQSLPPEQKPSAEMPVEKSYSLKSIAG